jgi:hypothetical protein
VVLPELYQGGDRGEQCTLKIYHFLPLPSAHSDVNGTRFGEMSYEYSDSQDNKYLQWGWWTQLCSWLGWMVYGWLCIYSHFWSVPVRPDEPWKMRHGKRSQELRDKIYTNEKCD